MPRSIGALRRSLAALVVVAASMMLMAGSALAHEHREVGDYELTVGFLNEPAILEEPNGVSLEVMKGHGDAGVPVEGLAGSLRAEVIYGENRLPVELQAAFGQPGAYKSDFIPTEIGAYTFHIFGSIEGVDIDESFTSGPETFSEVVSRDAMTFPSQVESVGDVAATANDASDTASMAMILGIAGLVAGLLGLGLGATAFMKARQAAPEAASVSGKVPQDAEN